MVKAAVYLRNLHPTKRVMVPLGRGWVRLLYPGVTTHVPERVLHTPLVRKLLIRKMVEVVDGAAWDADVRQRNASRADMARAIAAAEQREFDVLLKGVRRETRGAVDRAAAPYAALLAATKMAGLDTEALKALLNGETALPAALKGLGVKRLTTERHKGKRQQYVHWRQRNQSAETLLRAAQKALKAEDLQAAATWLAGQLAGAVPAAAQRRTVARWSPERVALLERRWRENTRLPQIAAELGVSRGAVLTKAHALELPGRHAVLDVRRRSARGIPLETLLPARAA